MKKLLFYCVFLIAFVNCKPEEEEVLDNVNSIIIELPSDVKSVSYPADSSNFDINLSSSIGLDSVYVKLDGVEITDLSKNLEGAKSATFRFSYVPKTADVGKSLNFFIEAIDIEGNLKRAEYLLYVQANLPMISFDLSQIVPDTVFSGEPIEKIITITSGIDLKSITTFLNGIEITTLTKTTFTNPFRDAYAVAYTPTGTDLGQVLTLQIKAVDQDDNDLSQEYKVFVKRSAPLVGVIEFWGIQMGGQTNATIGQFLDVETGNVYTKDQSAAHAADIDIISYYSNSPSGKYSINITYPLTGNASIIYPDLKAVPAIWSVRNTTQLRDAITTISPTDFNTMDTPEKIKALYDASGSSTSSSINSMKQDKLVVFKTGMDASLAGDTYGVIIVRASSGTQAGQVTFDYKTCN